MSKVPLTGILENARTGIYDYKFDKLQKIGEGGQGLVSKIKSRIDGKLYACKQLVKLQISMANYDKEEAI